jgi:RNA polymerase sigma-70 factor (ECF subfamily)
LEQALGKEAMEVKLKELFNRSSSGDRSAYENFLDLISVFVQRYLKYLSHGETGMENLDDLHQDVLLSIHLKKATYSIDRPILPWIYAITRYRYIDFYRKKKKDQRLVQFDDEYFHGIESNLSFDFHELLESLTPKQQEMLKLVKVEGMSYADAATDLHMSVSSLKVGIHRLVKSLKQRMSK